MTAVPPVVDEKTWRDAVAELRVREKAATHERDAIAAARRRLPALRMPEYRLTAEDGSTVTLADMFDGASQLVTYHHMWQDGAEWQCPVCTGNTASWMRTELLSELDARFVAVATGSMDDILAYKKRTGNEMTWYSSADSPFAADVDNPADGGGGFNVFLRDGDDVYRTWFTTGRGMEPFKLSFAISDVLPYGRQEQWQDVPDGWPQDESVTFQRFHSAADIAALYGE
ncbi:MAG: DUF899 domain-containing protein [Microbacterium sp.]|jgi:predicted dithiol-disulfide oxidoreductase (DUF899 family)|nr:DUF899 domain-containing protein [Microbacterium sp.]